MSDLTSLNQTPCDSHHAFTAMLLSQQYVTGAVTGNILGAKLGLAGIPEKFRTNLELYDTIIEVVDDLCNDCRMEEYGEYRDEVWLRKYVYGTYPE